MSLCRAVAQTLALPLRAPRSPALLRRDVPLQWMSTSKVPRPSGTNTIYYLVVGVTVSTGGYCAYKTVKSQQAKNTERVAPFKEETKAELQPLQGDAEGSQTASLEGPEPHVVEAEGVIAAESEDAAEAPEEAAAPTGGEAEAGAVQPEAVGAEPEEPVDPAAEASAAASPGVPEATRDPQGPAESRGSVELEKPAGDSEPPAGLDPQQEAAVGPGSEAEVPVQ